MFGLLLSTRTTISTSSPQHPYRRPRDTARSRHSHRRPRHQPATTTILSSAPPLVTTSILHLQPSEVQLNLVVHPRRSAPPYPYYVHTTSCPYRSTTSRLAASISRCLATGQHRSRTAARKSKPVPSSSPGLDESPGAQPPAGPALRLPACPQQPQTDDTPARELDNVGSDCVFACACAFETPPVRTSRTPFLWIIRGSLLGQLLQKTPRYKPYHKQHREFRFPWLARHRQVLSPRPRPKRPPIPKYHPRSLYTLLPQPASVSDSSLCCSALGDISPGSGYEQRVRSTSASSPSARQPGGPAASPSRPG